MITQRFVVQFDCRTVGIAVRVPGGFMFYASDDEFDEMDGRIFTRARVIEGQLTKIARRQKRAPPGVSGKTFAGLTRLFFHHFSSPRLEQNQ